MKPKLLLCLALVLCGVLFGCSTSSRHAASKLDLATYRIESVQNKKTAPEVTDWIEQQNFLTFSNSNIRVPLARSATAPSEYEHGFDPASLKLQWLKQDEFLLVSWTTFRLGSGAYTHDGNVILQIHDERCREIFRDHIESIAKGGWAAQEFSSLKIAYDDSNKTFKFMRRNTSINGNMGAPDIRHLHPFTTSFTNDNEEIGYLSKVDTIDAWDYKLARSKLKFLHGSSAVDVGDEAKPVEEIVNGFQVTRPMLELLNPDIRGKHETTGVVILKKEIKPYEVSSYDGLYGDK